MFSIIHSNLAIKIDFIILKNEQYRMEEFSRRQKLTIEEIQISVVAAEDLALSKLIWGKNSESELQLRDVRQILTSKKEIDWNYLEKWAKILGVEDFLMKAKR
jgi:hypothetical protein